MGKTDILRAMRQRVHAIGQAIDETHGKLAGGTANGEKVELAGRLAELTEQRDVLTEKLAAWEALPDDQWSNLETRIGVEWQDLIQDLEERWARFDR
jgi:hypothetical protein